VKDLLFHLAFVLHVLSRLSTSKHHSSVILSHKSLKRKINSSRTGILFCLVSFPDICCTWLHWVWKGHIESFRWFRCVLNLSTGGGKWLFKNHGSCKMFVEFLGSHSLDIFSAPTCMWMCILHSWFFLYKALTDLFVCCYNWCLIVTVGLVVWIHVMCLC